MSRGARDPYHAGPEWGSVTQVTADRDAEDAAGTFGARVAELRPDVRRRELDEALTWLVGNGQADVGGQRF
jgi:hypothetical protein